MGAFETLNKTGGNYTIDGVGHGGQVKIFVGFLMLAQNAHIPYY